MWLDLDDVTVQLNVERLEELFPNQSAAGVKKPKVEVKETKSLLDHNRAKNLGIFIVCVHVPIHVCLCVCVCVCVCMCVCACVHAPAWVREHAYMCLCLSVCVCRYMCAY